MALEDYFDCGSCLYSMFLDSEHLAESSIPVPDELRGEYIDCRLKGFAPVTEKNPEFNIKHSEDVGCVGWKCAICGKGIADTNHELCWNGPE